MRMRTALVPALLGTITALPALAADADWIAPVSTGATELTTSIVTLAGPLMGLALVAFGVWAVMTQRIEWKTLLTILFAAILIMVGPSAATWLLSKFKG